MRDFIREKVCFYMGVKKGQASIWEIMQSAMQHGVCGVELKNFGDELQTPDMEEAKKTLQKIALVFGGGVA